MYVSTSVHTLKQLPDEIYNSHFSLFRLFQTERKEQHFTPGMFTCMKLPEDKQDECSQTSLYEISRNRLRVIEKLGEGNFGMVSVLWHTSKHPTPNLTPIALHIHTWCRVTSRTRQTWLECSMIFNKQLSIPYYIDPLMRNGRHTRVQCHVDVPQKTSDRQIASPWLWWTKQVSRIIIIKNIYKHHNFCSMSVVSFHFYFLIL